MIIAIGGTYGSGGKRIAIRLSEILGYTLCDDVLAEEALKETGVDMTAENFRFFDESMGNASVEELRRLSAINRGNYIGAVNSLSADVIPLDRKMADIQEKIVNSFADKGNCILYGRCAGYYIRDRKDVIIIYTIDEDENRVLRIREHFPELTEKEAVKLIKKTDKRREDFYSFYTGRRWGDPMDNCMVMNVGSLGGADFCAEMIAEMVKIIG